MQFDATGTLLAVLGRNASTTVHNLRPTYLSLWDFTISPQYVNYVELPRKVRPYHTGCTNLVWSHRSDRIAMTFIKKTYIRQSKVKDTPTDLVIVNTKTCTLSKIFQVPFISSCIAFVPDNSDHLIASDGAGCMMSIIDTKQGTVTEVLTQSSFPLPTYNFSVSPVSSFNGTSPQDSELSSGS